MSVECVMCEKVVLHCNMTSFELTESQMSAIYVAETLEWTCGECLDVSGRSAPSVIPDDEEDDEDTSTETNPLVQEDDEDTSTETNPLVQVDANELSKNICVEVKEALYMVLEELKQSMQFHSDKMDEVLDCVFKQTISDLKRKFKNGMIMGTFH